MIRGLPPKLLGAISIAIGIFLAANKDYFQSLDTAKRVLSALLAILLWPLLLLDVNLPRQGSHPHEPK